MIGRVVFAVACVVTRCESDTSRSDVSPPTRLDVVMVPDGGQVVRCADVGGELVFYPDRPDALAWICEGVDY